MYEQIYLQEPPPPPQLQHAYGPQVHLLHCPWLLAQLAQLSLARTTQPQITFLVRELYRHLARLVLAAELPRQSVQLASRLASRTQPAVWQGQVIAAQTQAVSVDIARAGTLPAQEVYETLLGVLQPAQVRQDHLFMNRHVDAHGHVVDVHVSGVKIGGAVAQATLFIPDPMGATGGSLSRAVDIYKALPGGPPRKIIALHLIVTPEYLAHLSQTHPDVVIYAARFDRGLSSAAALASIPGDPRHHQRGLNERQYIVPGAGGLGELLNNTEA